METTVSELTGLAKYVAMKPAELDKAFRDSVRMMPPCADCGALYFVNEHGRIDILHKRPEAKRRERFEQKSMPTRVQPEWTQR
jgi:hypothetical protein